MHDDAAELQAYANLREIAGEVYRDAEDVGSPRPRPMLDAAVLGGHVTLDSDDATLAKVHTLACDALWQDLSTTGLGFESTLRLINAVGDILASVRLLKVGPDGGWVPDVHTRAIQAQVAASRQPRAEVAG